MLHYIYSQIGGKQVSVGSLSFAPAWILRESFETEMSENWKGAYEVVDDKDVPKNANRIGCHTIYKEKEDDKELRLKARNVLHGNRDKDRFGVRRDSASADLSVIRLVISLGVLLGFGFGTADVKGAYMQNGPIKRDIYVRPPKEFGMRGKLWKLLRLPYGIVEAGRQWLCVIEQWMLHEYEMELVFGVDQLFAKRGADSNIILIVAKVVDDFFVTGAESDIKSFFDNLDRSFSLRVTSRSLNLRFLGCSININSEVSVCMSMDNYLSRVRPVQISRDRKKTPHLSADDREKSEYRSLAGVLLYIGQAVLPHACFVASKIQQKLGSLKVGHIIDANTMVVDLKKLRPALTFKQPKKVSNVLICSLSDASHGGHDEIYGQSGVITGLKVDQIEGDSTLFHPISCSSHKQRRVSYSSFGAEVVAATCADDRGYDLKLSFASLFPDRPLRHELLVDSKALFETLTTLHQGEDYRLRKTVARMRISFESQELNAIRWIPGTSNYADALTKRNAPLWKKLNDMLYSGLWDVNTSHGCVLNSEEWS